MSARSAALLMIALPPIPQQGSEVGRHETLLLTRIGVSTSVRMTFARKWDAESTLYCTHTMAERDVSNPRRPLHSRQVFPCSLRSAFSSSLTHCIPRGSEYERGAKYDGVEKIVEES